MKETQALCKPGTAQPSTVLIQATATATQSDMELWEVAEHHAPASTQASGWDAAATRPAWSTQLAEMSAHLAAAGENTGKAICRPTISSGLLRGTGPKGPWMLAHNNLWNGRKQFSVCFH